MPKKADDTATHKVRENLVAGSLPYTVVYEDDCHVIAIYKNLSIVIWGAPASLAMVARLEALVEAAEKNPSAGRSTVHVIVAGTPPPAEEARARLVTLTERSAHRLACNVAVVEGDGFLASGIRGMVTGFHWIKDRRFKSRICASLEEVATWLPGPHAERTSTVLDEQELLDVLRGVRARIRKHGSTGSGPPAPG